jgi:two-component system chemotaxis response regulator CheB
LLISANRVSSKVVVIASSTGGVQALERIFSDFPADIPPIIVVQHLPDGIARSFAYRLNNSLKCSVSEAKSGDVVRAGHILIAPGGLHIFLKETQGTLVVECFQGKRLHGVMPAADVLFESASQVLKRNAVGVILTGMGADGASGLLKMRKSGARTIGQDKETCIVYGMPKVAKAFGAVEFELPLDRISSKIIQLSCS